MSQLQSLKQRFEIIGNDVKLNRALEKAVQVGPTDISVLVTGESGVGKEVVPKIIHALSHRKHSKYIAVNCGAIPEGTIDSELFGHEKGAFTGATQTRSGYFEEADGGTIFLDEVGELPLTTQVRLLRVLENGEFLKVGSSAVQKTNVRIVAATNVNMQEAIAKNKFREDLYYRLSTVEIEIPPLRERREDIHLLFRKFASDFAKKYNMPTIRLDENAIHLLQSYYWPGNIRQLRNTAEQLSVLEKERLVEGTTLHNYLPNRVANRLPAIVNNNSEQTSDFMHERQIMYKYLHDLKKDVTDLKRIVATMHNTNETDPVETDEILIANQVSKPSEHKLGNPIKPALLEMPQNKLENDPYDYAEDIAEEETLSLHDTEIELIKKSLERNRGKRKAAAQELGISERTLYRKIKQYDL
ncbi:MAG: sigma-54 interaction domain-containing protein [Flavobacteriaceae bacterium]